MNIDDREPEYITCYFCSTPGMEKKFRIETSRSSRVLWNCDHCGGTHWQDYGEKQTAFERRGAGAKSVW
jgi:RNase P subunit RPR2